MSTCRKILGLGLGSGYDVLGGLGPDASAVGLGLDASAVGLGLGLGYDALGGLRLDPPAAGLGVGLGATGELRIGLDVPASGLSVGLEALSRPTLGLGSSTISGQVSLGNLEGNRFSMYEQTTGRDDPQKRPQAVTHRIWVEEKPMDSTDQVSYPEAIVGLRLGRSGLMLLERSLTYADARTT